MQTTRPFGARSRISRRSTELRPARVAADAVTRASDLLKDAPMIAVNRSPRSSRVMLLLVASLIVAAGSYALAPILRPVTPPSIPSRIAVPVPGAGAPVDAGGGAESAPDGRLPFADRA